MVPLIVDDTLLEKPITLRFRFSKVGVLQYISHLDLVRTMTRVLIRAGMPVWYTQGFNPIPHLVFATPLSVGTESMCEFLDVRLVKTVDPVAACDAVNAQLPEQLRMLEAYYPETKLKELTDSRYIIAVNSPFFYDGYLDTARFVLESKPLTLSKKTKSGVRDVDISEGIRSLSVSLADQTLTVDATLAANSQFFLNPELLVRALREQTGILEKDPLRESYSIMRIEDYKEDGSVFR